MCIVSPKNSSQLIAVGAIASLASVLTLTPQAAHAQASYFYDITQQGVVDEMTVNSISSPASQYQIQNLAAGDFANSASYDPTTNRLYYVRNLANGTTTQLWYLQLDSGGAVTSENLVRTLPASIASSHAADYYNGRIWISNDTNVLYGFSTTNPGAAPVTMTLPTASGHPDTNFVGGDITFDDANNVLYIAGSHSGSSTNSFLYKYDISNLANPVLLANRDYSATTSDPFFNGITFNQDTSTLYGYYSGTSDLYTISQTALTAISTVGSNPELGQAGDLAGFTTTAQISVAAPEPSSVALLLGTLPLLSGIALARRKRQRLPIS